MLAKRFKGGLLLLLLVGGVIGARTLLAWDHLDDWRSLEDLPWLVAIERSGKSLIGAIVGAYIAGWLAKRALGYTRSTGDNYALALAVARKIIGQEISVDRQIVLNVVKGALDKVVDHQKVKIRINPQDLETVQTALFEFLPHVESLENVHFEADAGLTAGGCVVETNFGNIDARMENQLDQIETAFAAELEKNRYSK